MYFNQHPYIFNDITPRDYFNSINQRKNYYPQYPSYSESPQQFTEGLKCCVYKRSYPYAVDPICLPSSTDCPEYIGVWYRSDVYSVENCTDCKERVITYYNYY